MGANHTYEFDIYGRLNEAHCCDFKSKNYIICFLDYYWSQCAETSRKGGDFALEIR